MEFDAQTLGTITGCIGATFAVTKYVLHRAEKNADDAEEAKKKSLTLQIQGVRDKVVEVKDKAELIGSAVAKLGNEQVRTNTKLESLDARVARIETFWDRAAAQGLESVPLAPGYSRVRKKD